MRRKMYVLLAALGGSLMILTSCSSFSERFSRPESSSTAAESRASESNSAESAEAESEANVSVGTESGAVDGTPAEGEPTSAESTAETRVEGETPVAAESGGETAAGEAIAAETTAAESTAAAQTLARRFRNLMVEGDSLSVELSESIDGNFHLDYDGEPALQIEDQENETLYIKESGTAGKVLRIAVPRGTNLGELNFALGAGDLTVIGVNADSLAASLSLGDVSLQTVNVQRALLTLTTGKLRADALSTSDFKADAELSDLTVSLAEPLADFSLFARSEHGSVRSQGNTVDGKFLQRGDSGKQLMLRSEMGDVNISGLQ